MQLKTLITRTLSGIIYITLIIASILLGKFYFLATFGLLLMITIYEFHTLTNKQERVNALSWLSSIIGFLIFICWYISFLGEYQSFFIKMFILFFVMIAFIIEIFRKGQNPINNIAYTILGQIYLAVPFLFMGLIFKNNPIFLLSIFIIVWANDTFAYLSGSMIGRHKLCPSVSPKKSWEGFCGGLLGSMIVALFLPYLLPENTFSSDITTLNWLILAVIVVVFGTLGDLFESQIKRTIGVKDSGNIMPGHGGMLDRLDSVIFIAAPVYAYLTYIAF